MLGGGENPGFSGLMLASTVWLGLSAPGCQSASPRARIISKSCSTPATVVLLKPLSLFDYFLKDPLNYYGAPRERFTGQAQKWTGVGEGGSCCNLRNPWQVWELGIGRNFERAEQWATPFKVTFLSVNCKAPEGRHPTVSHCQVSPRGPEWPIHSRCLLNAKGPPTHTHTAG